MVFSMIDGETLMPSAKAGLATGKHRIIARNNNKKSRLQDGNLNGISFENLS
jgi:hypothetical protein